MNIIDDYGEFQVQLVISRQPLKMIWGYNKSLDRYAEPLMRHQLFLFNKRMDTTPCKVNWNHPNPCPCCVKLKHVNYSSFKPSKWERLDVCEDKKKIREPDSTLRQSSTPQYLSKALVRAIDEPLSKIYHALRLPVVMNSLAESAEEPKSSQWNAGLREWTSFPAVKSLEKASTQVKVPDGSNDRIKRPSRSKLWLREVSLAAIKSLEKASMQAPSSSGCNDRIKWPSRSYQSNRWKIAAHAVKARSFLLG